jgi:predicted XRE-type DNA-binding protein
MTRYPRLHRRGLIEGRGYEVSSGNVFADLELPDSDQDLLKARLTIQIYRLVKQRGLTQTKAAELLGTTQSQMSVLMQCQPVSISIAQLMEFLTLLGQDIEITVKPASPQSKGHMSLVVETA